MTAKPFRLALLVFLVVLGVGIAVLFAADAFPAGVVSAGDKGRFAGRTVGMLALVSAIAAWFVARRVARRR